MKCTAMATSTQPMNFLTQIIQPPERGSFSNCPENSARRKSGSPQAQTQGKKDQESEPWASHARNPGEESQHEGTDTGSCNHAEGEAHKEASEVARIRFCGSLSEAARKTHFPEPEEARCKEDQNRRYHNKDDGILEHCPHEAACQGGNHSEHRVGDGEAHHVTQAMRHELSLAFSSLCSLATKVGDRDGDQRVDARGEV